MKMHKGVYVREGTYDSYVVNEIERCYGQLDVRDKVVFDIGANIGAFTVWALDHGASYVHAFEPLPTNYNMLLTNTHKRERVETYEFAVARDTGRIDLFYVENGKNPGNTSQHVQRGRQCISVLSVGFQNMLDVHRPEVLKIDVEGAEYDWLYGDKLPDYVKQVAVELHLTKKEWRESDAHALNVSFDKWECLRQPKLDGGNWQTMGVWRRK